MSPPAVPSTFAPASPERHAARAHRRGAVLAALALGFLANPTVCHGQSETMDEAWQKASKLMIPEALVIFERIRTAGAPDERRVATFGTAIMLLNVQPKTDSNVEMAAGHLDQIAKSGEDDLGVLALYYRARIEQVHRYEPDLERAAALFTDLIERHPDHPMGQLALVKRGMIRLFSDVPLETRGQQLALLEESVGQLTHPSAKRSLHFLIADASSLLFDDNTRALTHLLAADEIGIARSKSQSNVWVRIGELARLTGRRDVASEYYQRFLKEYPRDIRHYTIAQRFEELSGAER